MSSSKPWTLAGQFRGEHERGHRTHTTLKRRVISMEEIYMYIGLLTALRVSHDSSDRNLSSSVETYPLNQGQISIFTEEVLKLAMTKGRLPLGSYTI